MNKTGLQSEVTDPTTPTAECPSGAGFTIEAVGAIPPVFDTGSTVNFRVDGGSSCKYGYKINVGGVDRSFSRVIYIGKTYSQPAQGLTEIFSISILNAARQVVRTFQFESEPFDIRLAANPTCTIYPATAYLNQQGSVRLTFTPAQAGRIDAISSPTENYFASPVADSLKTDLNTRYGSNLQAPFSLITKQESGVINFDIKDSQNRSGRCSVNIVKSDCNRYLSGDFMGRSLVGSPASQNLNINCDTKAIMVTPPQEGAYYFGQLSGTEPKLVIPGKIDGDAFVDLLVVREANDQASFQVLKSDGQQFTQQLNCTGSWAKLNASTPLPTTYELREFVSGSNAKIVGRQGGLNYEMDLTLSGSACAVSNPRTSSAAISIAAAPTNVDYNAKSVITWSAQNMSGYSCKLEQCAGTNCSGTNTVLEEGIQGEQIVPRTKEVQITQTTNFKATCSKTGVDPLSNAVTVTMNAGTGPVLRVRTNQDVAYNPVTFYEPNYADGTSLQYGYNHNDVYLSWNFPGSTGPCSLTQAPQGRDPQVVSNLATSATSFKRSVSGKNDFTLACGSESRTVNLMMGGAPVIQAGTQQTLNFANKEPGAVETRILKVQAWPWGGKIRIDRLRAVNIVSGLNFTDSTQYSVTGCAGVVLEPGQTCDASVTFRAGTYSTVYSGHLAVEYKRFNDQGQLVAGNSAVRSGFVVDRITSFAGNTRAQICQKQGKGKPDLCY
ncbi:MAG: hypothetical protein EBQ85_03575 [Proteobacteria bacterium]|nr:hypothetical protein [Pseudomonadota bacterium]